MPRTRTSALLAILVLCASASAAEIAGFTLIDADANSAIAPLADGDTLDLASLPTRNLSVRADVSGTPSTVSFTLSGADSHSQSEGVAPYALFGDSGGDYAAWTPPLGSYTLSAEADGGGGLTIGFSVVDGGSGDGDGSSGDDGDGSITIGGERRQWHRVDLRLAAVASSESANPNPFRDYRFNVAFTAPSGTVYDVPGYFAADGNGGDAGKLWIAHLNPHETGTWTYRVSFRQGSNAAVSLSDSVGSPVSPYDGTTGSFSVASSNKSGDDFRAPDKGMLVNRGHHYLTYGGSGEPFLYTGPGIPENILGYRGFTNTTIGIGHEFTVHEQHWNSGDPDWNGGAGRALIGALNYIADQGANCLYMMSNTIGGDGKDCFPHPTSTTTKDRYDLLKLQQWDIALSHAQARGIFLHWHLAEHESGNMFYYGAADSVERKLSFRMLNARFGHYNGLKWNIMEETEWSASEREVQMDYIHAVDPYDHPVTYQVGGLGIPYNSYDAHLGDPDIDAASFQGSASRGTMFNTIQTWRSKSAAAGEPWTCAWDEPQKIENDNSDEVNGYPMGRRDKMWPCLMAGGDGFMWYIQQDGGGHGFDQRIEDFRIMQNAFNWSGHIRDFLEPLPLLQMQSSRSIVDSSSGEDYTLFKSGEVYAIFNDRSGSGMSLDLSGVAGTFSVKWFDPRTGGALDNGSVTSLSGGGQRSLGNPPRDSGKDWAVLVQRTGSSPSNQPPVAQAAASPSSGEAPLAVSFSSGGSSDSDGTIASYAWSFGDGGSSNAANPSYSYASAGTYTATLTVTDDDGASDSDSVTITVTQPAPTGQQPFGGSPLTIAASGTTRLETEDYDLGGEGVAFHDTTSGNSGGAYRSDRVDLENTSDDGGGFNVGWIAAGEWLEYTLEVAAAGTYRVELRVARRPSGNVACHLELGGDDISGPIAVPSTGGWQNWTTVDATVELAAGTQVLRLAMDGSNFNVNWLEFTPLSVPESGIARLVLFDAVADTEIATLVDGAVIDLAAVGDQLTIAAELASGASTPVTFTLGGTEAHSQTENQAPYALFGDASGDYHAWTPALGSYTLSVTAGDGTGTSIGFEVVDGGADVGVVVAAINAGGGAFTAADGIVYAGDGQVSGGRTYSSGDEITGTLDDVLYRSERYGDFAYAIPVEDGDYLLTLQFAEIYWNGDGKRVFDVSIEGDPVVTGLDLHAQVGHDAAYDVVVPVSVTDGVLDLVFSTDVNNAKLSALRLETAAAVSQ